MNIKIPILMYHQISTKADKGFMLHSVTPGTFRNHMRMLNLMGYNTINMDQFMDYRTGRITLPPKPVVITFDDGYQDCIDHAVPVLDKYGFTAVFYIPTGFVGKMSSWTLPSTGVEYKVADWEVIKDLDLKGFQIAAHSVTHPKLAEITEKQCFLELIDSKKQLEETLGHEVLHMAYPYGSYNDDVVSNAKKAGYQSCCTVLPGFGNLKKDPLRLPRVEIRGNESALDYFFRLKTAHRTRVTFKHIFRKIRNF